MQAKVQVRLSCYVQWLLHACLEMQHLYDSVENSRCVGIRVRIFALCSQHLLLQVHKGKEPCNCSSALLRSDLTFYVHTICDMLLTSVVCSMFPILLRVLPRRHVHHLKACYTQPDPLQLHAYHAFELRSHCHSQNFVCGETPQQLKRCAHLHQDSAWSLNVESSILCTTSCTNECTSCSSLQALDPDT